MKYLKDGTMNIICSMRRKRNCENKMTCTITPLVIYTFWSYKGNICKICRQFVSTFTSSLKHVNEKVMLNSYIDWLNSYVVELKRIRSDRLDSLRAQSRTKIVVGNNTLVLCNVHHITKSYEENLKTIAVRTWKMYCWLSLFLKSISTN